MAAETLYVPIVATVFRARGVRVAAAADFGVLAAAVVARLRGVFGVESTAAAATSAGTSSGRVLGEI